MTLNLLLILLLALLGACAPVTAPQAPSEPLLFSTDYDSLFDATLQSLAGAYVPAPAGGRYTYAITEASRDTGLITALRESAGRVQGSAQLRSRDAFSLRLLFPVEVPVRRQSIITTVVRPVSAERASLIYSSTSERGTSSRVADAYMHRVVETLRKRFGTPASESPTEVE